MLYAARRLLDLDRRTAWVLATVILAGVLVIVVSPADRAPAATSPKYLLALGDSLAAGYQPAFGSTLPAINPSSGYRDRGYPASYAADVASARGLNLVDLGCPGETTASMLGTPALKQCANLYAGEFGAQSQLAAARTFLSRHLSQVGLVTIDIGANDLEHCVSTSQVSTSCLKRNDIATVKNLVEIVSSLVSSLRRSDPLAQFASMNYYDPFLGLAFSPGGSQGIKLAAASLAATNIFNTELTTTFHTFRVASANVASAFNMNSAVPLSRYDTKLFPENVVSTCQLTWMCPEKSNQTRDIHPNSTGYRTIAKAFQKVLKP